MKSTNKNNYTCRFCKKRGGKIQADGRTLCIDCHKRVTYGWKPFEKDFRKAFVEGLLKLAETNDKILIATCDVGFSFLEKWQEKYPNRYFNFGVTEMSTAIICSGLALSGFRPVFYSMINFVLYRPFEAIRNAIGYHSAPVLLVGVQGSAKYKMLGFSHTSLKNEDINTIDNIPNMRIYLPMEEKEVLPMLEKIFSEEYPAYIRL